MIKAGTLAITLLLTLLIRAPTSEAAEEHEATCPENATIPLSGTSDPHLSGPILNPTLSIRATDIVEVSSMSKGFATWKSLALKQRSTSCPYIAAKVRFKDFVLGRLVAEEGVYTMSRSSLGAAATSGSEEVTSDVILHGARPGRLETLYSKVNDCTRLIDSSLSGPRKVIEVASIKGRAALDDAAAGIDSQNAQITLFSAARDQEGLTYTVLLWSRADKAGFP